jgi:O-antigen/teichoic acid export membrane protein
MVREENFLSLTGNLVIAFFGIAGFAILARSLSVDMFGQWVLFIAAGSFTEMFRFGITNTGLIRYLSGADENTRVRLIGSNALIGTGATLSIAVVLIDGLQFFLSSAGTTFGLWIVLYLVSPAGIYQSSMEQCISGVAGRQAIW